MYFDNSVLPAPSLVPGPVSQRAPLRDINVCVCVAQVDPRLAQRGDAIKRARIAEAPLIPLSRIPQGKPPEEWEPELVSGLRISLSLSLSISAFLYVLCLPRSISCLDTVPDL
jgi:hypothetical protein